MKIRSVKKYTTRFRKLAFSGVPDEEVLASSTSYDKEGKVVEELKIDDDEGTNERTVYVYNEDGKLVRMELHMEDDQVSEHFVYERDEKGRVLSEQKFYGDDPGEKVEYDYDNSENPVRIDRFDADQEPEVIELVTYNPKGKPEQHVKLSPDEVQIEKSEITYDEKGNPVQKSDFNEFDELVKITLFNYNESDDLVRVTEKSPEGKVFSDIVSAFNDRGLLTERKIRDYHPRILKFEYDERNNCIGEEVYDEHGNLLTKLSFEYDDQNNMINESGYFLNTSGSGQHNHTMNRYEYEFWEE